MHRLIVRQVKGAERFVVSHADGRSAEDEATVASPVGWAVVRAGSEGKLSGELRWYLESFLDYPFPPQTTRAEAVEASLEAWGAQAFTALFGAGTGRDFYSDAARSGLEQLHLQIISNDASVLAWPWEALRDPQVGPLATACRIERRLDGIRPVDLPAELPKDHIHILLVTARPYQGDVEYRSLSRPLVDLIEERQLPARVTVLRPPTFDALREHLRGGHYHLVHFDGHGAYGHRGGPESVSGHRLRAHQGRLIFEDEDGAPVPVEAEQLSALLREHRIPMMVLNACQSATHAEGSEDVFASVATALLRAGVRSVVAMAYSLFVSGGRVFLPAFYRRLFETGNPSEAVRAGRQQMFQDKRRLSARGPYPLEDWLVPVLYQLEAPVLPFAARAAAPEAAPGPALPEEARDSENPYGFIGRDGAILALERALRRRPAGILIHGLGGVGKTTLARGLLHWLGATSGLGEGVFWFTFQDIRTSEYVINRLVEGLFGTEAMTAPTAQKLEALIKTLKAHRVLIVWDNFESVSGIPGVIEGHLPPEDRAQLAILLKGLRGGQSKILITSRSEEAWLGREHCFKLPLGGLHGEERWAFCTTILKDLGLSAKQDDQDLADLMALLDGHPLAMRALLPGLAEHSAKRLTDIVEGHLADFPAEDPAQQRLFATLRFVEETLPERLRPLLVPIGLHERYLDADHLEQMAKTAQIPHPRADIDQCLAALGTAGLVHDRGQATYELHPALTGFLRSRLPALGVHAETDAWRRAFVDTLGGLADWAAQQPDHILRGVFHYHEANLQTALELAEALAMHEPIGALLQALGVHAQAQRHLPEAARYYTRLAEHLAQTRGEGEHLAAAYHQLGMIAQEQRDFPTAEAWYRKSLAIEREAGQRTRGGPDLPHTRQHCA